jgi:RNA polymerase sigma-70 factor (sigma-E family)
MRPTSADNDAFTAFVTCRQAELVRLGEALTGDRQLGEDLAQTALQRLWPRWHRVAASGEPLAYTQRIMVNLWTNWRGARRWQRERVGIADSEPALTEDPTGSIDDHDVVHRWLGLLPPKQRATVVLRFLLDLSVQETAQRLGCSTGTVKSQTARALTTLGARLGEPAGRREKGPGG